MSYCTRKEEGFIVIGHIQTNKYNLPYKIFRTYDLSNKTTAYPDNKIKKVLGVMNFSLKLCQDSLHLHSVFAKNNFNISLGRTIFIHINCPLVKTHFYRFDTDHRRLIIRNNLIICELTSHNLFQSQIPRNHSVNFINILTNGPLFLINVFTLLMNNIIPSVNTGLIG